MTPRRQTTDGEVTIDIREVTSEPRTMLATAERAVIPRHSSARLWRRTMLDNSDLAAGGWPQAHRPIDIQVTTDTTPPVMLRLELFNVTFQCGDDISPAVVEEVF